jgi:NADPH-dependent 2,4-dienoyl-CoA reductase/sulfur reductase-like enzyme
MSVNRLAIRRPGRPRNAARLLASTAARSPAFAGDTLASALVANGIRLVGRSFKYHRPRGIVSAGPEEPNALVEKGAAPGASPTPAPPRSSSIPASTPSSQNRWPSLRFDIQALGQLASPLLGAGFYYKTFMWPAALWEKLYEPAIRRAAGLGRLSGAPDPDTYDKAYAFCDLLVIGAGRRGLAAALTAGRAGARVILLEAGLRPRRPAPLGRGYEIDGMPGPVWAREAEAELAPRLPTSASSPAPPPSASMTARSARSSA